MASDKNIVTIDGNITKDPVLKYTANGTAICTFSIASNRFYKKNNEFEKETSFFDVQAWSSLVLDVNEKSKGQAVSIQGRLKQDRWQQGGQNRSRIVIVANDIQFITRERKQSYSPYDNEWRHEDAGDRCPF